MKHLRYVSPRLRSLVVTAVAVSLALPLTAMAAPLDEVVEKHIAAKGGRDAWDAIESLKLTGQFTGFSKIKPFTLHKKRDRYHMDHMLGDKPVVAGYDGETAWWRNEWLGPGIQNIEGPDLAVFHREVDFATPLFDLEAKGHKAELLGDVDVDGEPAVGIKITRGDGSEETWFLHPDTYLEMARRSPGSDFGRPMPQLTFFDDFRDVAGVQIPHYTETQWYTRHRVMEVADIEANVAVDESLFRMPPPTGMGPLQSMIGNWKVKFEQRQQPGAPWSESEHTAAISGPLRGGLIHQEATTAQGNQIISTLSYDSFRERYRATSINDVTNLQNVLEGTYEDGRLTLSNVGTGTTTENFGMTFHSRVHYFDITDAGFSVEIETSIDGGENWAVLQKMTYTRAE